MPVNLPGPYQIEIPYQVGGFFHYQKLNCVAVGTPAPGDAPADIELAARGPDNVTVEDGVAAYWALARAMMSVNATATSYTLWKLNPLNTDRQYISSGPLSPTTGAGGAYVTASQITMTFRTANGGIAKIEFLESYLSLNSRDPIDVAGSSAVDLLAAYVLSVDNWIIARDDSWPVQALNASYGQNEKVWRRRYRS